MAEVLGWPIRQPLVSAADRPRVLGSWAEACAGRLVRQRSVPFREIREVRILTYMRCWRGRHEWRAHARSHTRPPLTPTTSPPPPHSGVQMSAEAFVKLLAHDLKAKGVIAGSNYRFGACARSGQRPAPAALP
jgi:hypothetical protein